MTDNHARSMAGRPLIAHVVFRFDYGGLENGVVNLVNGLPERAFRHAIIALSAASDFRTRIRRPDVTVHALNKQPGKDPGAYLRLFSLLRKLRPAVVHTRNLGTLEAALVARLAGVPVRIHGEHGWDVIDPDGASRKYRTLRKLISPAVHQYVAVSREIAEWLSASIGVPATRITRICNGVDTARFHPREGSERALLPPERFPPDSVVVGSVTRFSEIKDPLNLVRAFIAARHKPHGELLRLLMIGDGGLRAQAERLLRENQADGAAWLPGSRDDIAELMRAMDVFVLGSKREGISNTVLEAMASGLPAVASATGGNLELIVDGAVGRLVPPGDSAAIAAVLLEYARNPTLREEHGRAARTRAVQEYSLGRMLADYEALYRAHCIELGEAA
jgi:sugar transferase (PEP-CTERM/EpsH1 system associated)